MTHSGLGSNPGQGIGFELVGVIAGMLWDLFLGQAQRVHLCPLINCDRPLHSGIRAPEL